MEITGYNFFFHPLHQDHSCLVKAVAVITAVALAALSLGAYLLLVGFVLSQEKDVQPLAASSTSVPRPLAPPQVTVEDAAQPKLPLTPKAEVIKLKQKDHLQKLRQLPWKDIQIHTHHPHSGFDWWMVPIDEPSSKGTEFTVYPDDVNALRLDSDFMTSYREGVCLIAASWGWDLNTGENRPNAQQHWAHYPVRLGKMLHSLLLFEQYDLHAALVKCIDSDPVDIRPTLHKWKLHLTQDYLPR